MNNRSTNGLSRYLSRRKDEVQGWFSYVDAQLLGTITNLHNERGFRGAVAEIGVHHGKMFIALCLSLSQGERAYAIDVFDDQSLNIDKSGRGDRAIFESNLRKFGVPFDNVVIRQCSSLDVRAEEILRSVGSVRFFSIDGGHWREIVENDLSIAEGCLSEFGVIALDDFHRPEWPEVSLGYFDWCVKRRVLLEPFAIGFNKLYICRPEVRAHYQAAIMNNPSLTMFRVKEVVFQGISMPVFSQYLFPDYGMRKNLTKYLLASHPKTLSALRNIKAKLKPRR